MIIYWLTTIFEDSTNLYVISCARPSGNSTHLYRGNMAVVSVYTNKLLELAPQAGGFQVSSYGNRKQRDFSFLFLQWRNDSVVITSDFTLSSGRLNCPEVLLAGLAFVPVPVIQLLTWHQTDNLSASLICPQILFLFQLSNWRSLH